MRRKLFALVLFVLLASCNPVHFAENDTKSGSGTPVETISAPTYTPTIQKTTRTPFLTKTPTEPSFPRLTATLQPKATSASTSVTEPEIIWGEGFLDPIILEKRIGIWSPTANELLLFDSVAFENPFYLATAPDFFPVSLSTTPLYAFSNNPVQWSPDGQKIYFSGPLPESSKLTDDKQYSTVWVVNRDGSGLRSIFSEERDYRWLEFYGWLDKQLFIVWGYGGGGHQSVNFVDSRTDAVAAGAFYYGDTFETSKDYLAALVGDPLLQVFAISRETQPPGPEYISGDFYKLIPIFDPDGKNSFYTMFADWLPDTNTMLVKRIDNYEGGEQSLQLLLWDVDKNEITTIVPDGLSGFFSPDGKYLAFVTRGPSILSKAFLANQVGSGGNTSGEDPEQTFIQLIDLISSEIVLCQPVVSHSSYDYFWEDIDPRACFSPDGQYFSFVVPAEAEFPENYKFPDDIHRDETKPLMITYDLSERKVFFVHDDYSLPAWSPAMDHFIVRDENENLLLFDQSAQSPLPITQNVGDHWLGVSWSFDGSYIAIRIGESNFSPTITAILPVPK